MFFPSRSFWNTMTDSRTNLDLVEFVSEEASIRWPLYSSWVSESLPHVVSQISDASSAVVSVKAVSLSPGSDSIPFNLLSSALKFFSWSIVHESLQDVSNGIELSSLEFSSVSDVEVSVSKGNSCQSEDQDQLHSSEKELSESCCCLRRATWKSCLVLSERWDKSANIYIHSNKGVNKPGHKILTRVQHVSKCWSNPCLFSG